jgi:hypothetical protein
MFTASGQRYGSPGKASRRSRRRGRRAGAAVLAAVAVAGLLAATASAQPPSGGATTFVHSAVSGKLGGGRLTLHGVAGRVTWAHYSGRSGVLPVKRLHRRLFSSGTAAVVGTLHVAGHRGGDEPTFKLSKPRYSRARRTVSYRVKRLGKGRLPGRRGGRAAGAARRFGFASLSMVAGPSPAQEFQWTCTDSLGGRFATEDADGITYSLCIWGSGAISQSDFNNAVTSLRRGCRSTPESEWERFGPGDLGVGFLRCDPVDTPAFQATCMMLAGRYDTVDVDGTSYPVCIWGSGGISGEDWDNASVDLENYCRAGPGGQWEGVGPGDLGFGVIRCVPGNRGG